MSIQLERGPLDEESIRLAEVELRETPEIKSRAIEELRLLLREDGTLRFDESDEFLTMILRPVKFYPESAYAMMKRIADYRKANAKVLKNVSPIAEENSFLNENVVNVLKNRDQNRRRILIMNMGREWEPSRLDTDKLFRLLYLIHFGACMEPVTQVHGAIIIMDFSGLGFKQAKSFTPAFSDRLLSFIQKAMPLRLKAVHIVFQPMVFKIVWALFAPLVKEKLKKRIFFHGSNLASLHEHIDPDYLPDVYGGTRGTIDYSSVEWYPVMAEVDETIKDWHSYGYAD